MNESRKIFGSSALLVQAGVVLTSCFIGAGFVWVLRPQPEPSPPRADIVELPDRSRSSSPSRCAERTALGWPRTP